jgi:hypothetical protein
VQIKEIPRTGHGDSIDWSFERSTPTRYAASDRFAALLNLPHLCGKRASQRGGLRQTRAPHASILSTRPSLTTELPAPSPPPSPLRQGLRIFPAFALQSRGDPLATESCADWNEKSSRPENACKYRHECSGRRKAKSIQAWSVSEGESPQHSAPGPSCFSYQSTSTSDQSG